MRRYDMSNRSKIKVIACQKCGDSWVSRAEPTRSSCLFVSHDREFVGGLATRVIEYLKAQAIET
jgi:hypothetical protein